MSNAGTRAWVLGLWIMLTTLSVGWYPSVASADPRNDYLVRLLQSSSQFRVRAQAAISLGRVAGDPAVVSSLAAALNDEHPAVRAAAASSLERLGNPDALGALRKRANDSHEEVRAAVASALSTLQRLQTNRGSASASSSSTSSTPTVVEPPVSQGTPTYYVGVGLPGSRVTGVDDAALEEARTFLRSRLVAMDGVLLAPENERPKQAESLIRARNLTGYFIDSSIVSIEPRGDGGVRASVSIIVGTYPGRDMRSILQGAATVMGGGSGARAQAIEAAFTGALRNLGQAMAAGRR